MVSEIDLSQFWCWNEECTDYGKQDHGNIVIKQRYGKDNRALLIVTILNNATFYV